jgi:hypothetical protein
MRSNPDVEPRWAPRRWILDRYHLPVRALDRAVAAGWVRTCKWSESRQGARQFFVPDVERLLLELAAGRTPTRVAGRLR